MDIDGVITDGTFWWNQNEIELKRFCFADIIGIPLAKNLVLYLRFFLVKAVMQGRPF